jgi:signal transduction histidine kinase/DNA-binding response OmpR family regulator
MYIGHIIHSRGKKAWYKTLFNIAQHTISIGVTGFIFSHIVHEHIPGSLFHMIMIGAACGVYILLTMVLMGAVTTLAETNAPYTFEKFKQRVLSTFYYIDIVLFTYGVVLGSLWFVNPYLFALGVGPVFAMQWALRLNTDLTNLSAKQQQVQEAMTGLLAAGDVSHQLKILLNQLSELFPAAQARIVLFGLNPEDDHLIIANSDEPELKQICSQTELLRQVSTDRETRRIDQDPFYKRYCTMPTFLVPLATSTEAVGAMLVAVQSKALDTIETRLLVTYVTQAALAVVQSRLIDRIQASQEQIVRSERLAAVGTLAASLAHEFNNILAIIGSNAELAGLKQECDTHRKALSLIGMTAKRGGSITRGLLTFTRQIDPYRELAEIHDAIEPVLAMLKTRFRDAKVQLIRDLAPVSPLVCDIGLLSQAFLNLITNALDAMHPKGGTLTVKLWEEAHAIKLRVTDTGIGIPEEIRHKLFEPFTTSKHESDEGVSGGNGLGLAITHGIITSHNGAIEVESVAGQGTSITITLPASTTSLHPANHLALVQIQKRLRVMVVDDEPLIAMALAQIVEMDNHEVAWFTDPELALVHISQRPPDILMADIHMPNLDGITLLQFAKEFAPAMQQMLVTGQIEAHQRHEIHALGAEVVYKPFSVADIRVALNRAGIAAGGHTVHLAPEPARQSEVLQIAPAVAQQQVAPAIRGTIRHQVMNHVTALEGFVPMLQQATYGQSAGHTTLDRATLLCHVARVVGALGVLVRAQRLLYLGDYDSQPIVLPVAPVVLYPQLLEARNRVSTGLLPHEQIAIEVDCPPALTISGNAMSLLTACTAALYNSVEAITRHPSKNPQSITVAVRCYEEQITLRIEDTGPGFAPQILDQIARQIDQGQGEQFIAALQPRHGVGLGIAVMVRVAYLHGGTIAFGNYADRGAWVQFTLPVTIEAAPAQMIPSTNVVLERVAM